MPATVRDSRKSRQNGQNHGMFWKNRKIKDDLLQMIVNSLNSINRAQIPNRIGDTSSDDTQSRDS